MPNAGELHSGVPETFSVTLVFTRSQFADELHQAAVQSSEICLLRFWETQGMSLHVQKCCLPWLAINVCRRLESVARQTTEMAVFMALVPYAHYYYLSAIAFTFTPTQPRNCYSCKFPHFRQPACAP